MVYRSLAAHCINKDFFINYSQKKIRLLMVTYLLKISSAIVIWVIQFVNFDGEELYFFCREGLKARTTNAGRLLLFHLASSPALDDIATWRGCAISPCILTLLTLGFFCQKCGMLVFRIFLMCIDYRRCNNYWATAIWHTQLQLLKSMHINKFWKSIRADFFTKLNLPNKIKMQNGMPQARCQHHHSHTISN